MVAARTRISPAQAVPVWDQPGGAWAAFYGLLVLAAAAAFLLRADGRLRAGLPVLAALVLLLGVGLAAAGAAPLPLSRASPSGAAWLALAALVAVVLLATARVPTWGAGAAWTGLLGGIGLLALLGVFDHLALVREARARQGELVQAVGAHLLLALAALLPALAIGAALGVLARRRPSVLAGLTVVQVIPALALFTLLMAPLGALGAAVPALRDAGISGIGAAPAVIGVIAYLLLPIAASVAAGLSVAGRDVLDAARGMGLTPTQILLTVRLPLGMPVFLGGLRTASVQAVGLMALGALVGADGLGRLVFQGIGQFATDLILLGALPIGLLAVALDLGFRALGRLAEARP